MSRILKVGLWAGVALVLVAVAAALGLVLAAGGLGAAGYEDQRAALEKERQALEEKLVMARVVLDNLDTYQKDREALEAAARKRGLLTPEAQVLASLAEALKAKVELKPGPEETKLVVLSKPGGVSELLELSRGAESARLLLVEAALGPEGARVEAQLLPRAVLRSRPEVVRKGVAAKVPWDGEKPLLDLTGVATERKVLERTRQELAALEASAPGILEMLEKDVPENKALEGLFKRWDRLYRSSLSSLEIERARPVLGLMERASLTASQARLVLQGAARDGAPASAIVGPLGAFFEVTRASEAGPLRVEMKRAVERSAE